VSETDNRVVLAVDDAGQRTPVRVYRADQDAVLLAVVESAHEHVRIAIGARYVEAGFDQLHRVKSSSGCNVQHLLLSAPAQHVDEEAALALGSGVPVD